MPIQNFTFMFSLAMAIAVISMMLIVIWFFTKRVCTKRRRRATHDAKEESQKYSPRPTAPHNEPLARNKIYEKKRQEELNSNVTFYNPHGKAQEEGARIVGVVEPHGFWSKFIMSQKLGYIMARLNIQQSSKKNGFWVNLIKAQSASQGKNQSRGR